MTALADDTGTAAEASAFSSLLRLRAWTRPHRKAIIVMIASASGAMLLQSLVPLIVGQIVDGPIRHHDTAALWPLAGLALLFGLGEAVLFFIRRYAMARAALGIETDMRRDLFAHVQRLPVAFHDQWPSGQLLSRLTTDLSTIRRFVGFAVVFLIANTATTVIVLILLLHIHLVLGLLVLLAMTPLAVFTRTFELRYSREARRAQDLTGDLATAVEESALGIRVIKSYGRRPQMLAGFTRDAQRLRGAELTKIKTLARFWALLEGLPQLILAGVAFGGVFAVAHNQMTIGQFVAFLTLYLRLIWPIITLGWLLALTQEAASAARRIFEVIDTVATILDPAEGAAAEQGSSLRFENVRFRYEGADDEVLRGVDLEVAAGETMALVGSVGSGKTTLTALPGRLYDVTGGRVLLGGVDVRDLRLDQLRHAISTAFEEATLFSASVRENLSLGRAGITDDDITEAIEVAQAEFVYELPFGLETRIGEQGLSLSGGQRQRLALARAVLGRPRVLVLDDPLSALDVHTEAQVEAALRRVLAGTTALVVAHRPSTVMLADRVALLVDGRIAAVGTHSELLASVPEYRNLLAQTSEFEGVTS
ncbi:MAG: ATP-binding cassette, subfamily bacterial [Pseudonocardiales bacterium]|nr:transporter related [Pseudonocardiales bacterium]MDT4959020.1 ATP-binding cassette, subfamily bacterial [Pseudonocardiales bacterium]MDT4972624.1 ATP-binding cassette, subfamily bacterial [Pseudonocardiales bacterium]MDT4978990.1 ATP-binding cassette, subfamily bacterial [Pseudonocardiales bacterium]